MVSNLIQRRHIIIVVKERTAYLFCFSRLAVSMLAAVEYQQERWEGSDQEFALKLCASLSQRLMRMFESFISDQTRIIEEIKVSSKKRRGVLSFFRTFPLFAMRLEAAAAHVQPESATRSVVNEAYEKVIQTMMASLDSIARESDQTGDDKEQLNATIMYIGKWNKSKIKKD